MQKYGIFATNYKTMAKLKISNFGPIKDAELDFKKVNILIGQQGAGKSCILKIAAFCMWIEKVYLSGEIADLQRNITQKEFVEKYLLEFYKLEDMAKVSDKNYTKIVYNSNGELTVEIEFKKSKNVWYNIIDKQSAIMSRRVAYIPTERCLASAVTNLMGLRINQNTNIYKYLVDWEDARKIYSEKNQFDVLNLNTSFFYDEKSSTDFLSVKNSGEIRFTNAASGFQSIVPLCILSNYYLNNGQILSMKEKQRVNDLKKLIDYYAGAKQDDVVKIIKGNIENINNKRSCALFLEEPEANIYPETQYNLIKWLVSALKNGQDNSMFMATHSPYIITVTNNLIYAAKVGKHHPEKIRNLIPENLWLTSDNVAAYIIKDGVAQSIVDEELGEIDPEFIDSISQTINHEYGQMRNIEYGIEED